MHDLTHDMYMPDRRPKKTRAPATAKPAPPKADIAGREAWMRQRQQAARRFSKETIDRVILETCQRFEITRASLLSKSRLPDISAARGEVCRQLHAARISLKEIGRALHIHHASVIYHLEPRPAPEPERVSFPDESGVWAI